jgi:hypothetical protein
MKPHQSMRISELLLHCCNGAAGSEETAELEALLSQNHQAQEYCVEILMDLNYFHCLAQTPLSRPENRKGQETDFMCELDPQQQMALLDDFAEYEKSADAMEVIKPVQVREEPPASARIKRPARTINKFSLAAAILCGSALLLMILYGQLSSLTPYEVATITDSIDVQWSAGIAAGKGSRLASDSRPIVLSRGIVKLRTDEHVEVVLEAPTEFMFRSSSEIALNYGKLFARVSEQGSGFSVVTPNSKIVDLGTEFGILSHIDGNTEVHLYKGKANLFAGEKDKRKISHLITEGFAVRVNSRNSTIQEIALDQQALVRNIDSEANLIWKGQKALYLVDLLLGGNGFGTAARQTVEFDPTSGKAVESGIIGYRPGADRIVPAAGSPYLDSIFVPPAEGGQIPVSTAGHRFDECPKTSGLYYSNVCCMKDWTFFQPLQQIYDQTYRQYPDYGVLYLHSNIGLTVDLDAVRSRVPGLRIASFSTFAGILQIGSNLPDYAEADAWILVDGRIRSVQKQIRADQGYTLRVNLSDSDRFLTLLVTDGGTAYVEGWPANHLDTCGFAEPVFSLSPR